MSECKKPFPTDALIVLAGRDTVARRREIGGPVHTAKCQDCECALVMTRFTFRAACRSLHRMGRVIRFLCLRCRQDYEAPDVSIVPIAEPPPSSDCTAN